MRRLLVIALVAIGTTVVSPRPASAQGIWRWFESLSGPGPSHGYGFELALICHGNKKTSAIAAESTASSERTWFPHVSCGPLARDRVRVSIGLSASWLSGENTLEYAAGPQPDVDITTWIGFVDIGVHRAIDLGVGAGVIQFGNLPVNSFSRFAFQPVRVSVKPLALKVSADAKTNYRREFIVLKYEATMLADRLEAIDFGAVPDTFKMPPGEIMGSFTVLFDVLALIGK
jgi:hypothetical protein